MLAWGMRQGQGKLQGQGTLELKLTKQNYDKLMNLQFLKFMLKITGVGLWVCWFVFWVLGLTYETWNSINKDGGILCKTI